MRKTAHKQNGVVLVIGLLMLLVITIVGVTAMSGTTTNERMTANHQFQTLSFQAAESAIHDVFNVPSVTPALSDSVWRNAPAPNNYDVDIGGTGGAMIGVQAQALIQFCGELTPTGTQIKNGNANPGDVNQVYDIRGSGNVASLGSMETHMRRGTRLASGTDLPFDSFYCEESQ